MIFDLLKKSFEKNASDLHISTDRNVNFRILGELKKDEKIMSERDMEDALKTLLSSKEIEELYINKSKSFSVGVPVTDQEQCFFRGDAVKTSNGLSMVFRTINSKLPTLESLKCPLIFKDLINHKQGLVLITGATGSGKSTTLAAMINEINNQKSKNIITIEHPIEYRHGDIFSLVRQREVGKDINSFADGIRDAMRADPDVILIGEMRDKETISAALQAAETGHLVFATLHSNSSSSTINRIIDIFPHEQQDQIRTQLSLSLRAVINQVLIKRSDTEERMACHEIMINNKAVANLIRKGDIHLLNGIMQTNSNQGMQTLNTALKKAFLNKMITKESALDYSNDRIELEGQLNV